MTYVRLTGGRDRGHVKDLLHEDAQRMLGNGEALPVDFDEPDPLGFREIPAPAAERQCEWRLVTTRGALIFGHWNREFVRLCSSLSFPKFNYSVRISVRSSRYRNFHPRL
jgi:hypothetical protein